MSLQSKMQSSEIDLEAQLAERNAELAAMRASTSWRLTAPLRAIAALLGRSGSNSAPAGEPRAPADEKPAAQENTVAVAAHPESSEPLSAGAERERSAIATAVHAFAGLSAMEPEMLVSIAPAAVGNLRVLAGFPKGPELEGWRKLFNSLEHEYRRMIFIPSFDFGGIESVRNAVRAAHERLGTASTLVIATDAVAAADHAGLPPGTHVRSLSEFDPHLSPGARAEIVIMLVYHLQPAAVLNIESVALWDAIDHRGAALSTVTKIYAALSPRERAADGRAVGTTDRYFRSCLPFLTKAYVDDAAFADGIAGDFGLPGRLREKLAVLHQPAAGESGDAGHWQKYLQTLLEKPSFLE